MTSAALDLRWQNRMRFELVDPRSPFAERTWKRLEAVSKPVYFLTWGWIENWLDCLPADQLPQLAIVTENGLPISAFFVVRRRLLRYNVLPSRGLFINTVGDARFDELCIEHNAMVGRDLAVEDLIGLLPPNWDELFLPAMRADALGGLADRDLRARSAGYQVRVDEKKRVHHVDLAKVRAKGDYISLLGSSTRSQIRRARKKSGTLELDVATTLAEAMVIYDEMCAFHGRYWRSRGQFGVFADPWFDRFHRTLIEKRFAHGEIQLLRLRSDGDSVGCLYNFVAHGHVAFYQSGLNHIPERDLKPGYQSHVAAIEHSARAGHAIYDFLAGDARYKQNLGTDATDMVWARVQKKLARFALEDRVRRLRLATGR